MCLECGFYKGKMIVDMQAKKAARQARLEKKREAMQSMAEAQGVAPEEQAATEAETTTEEEANTDTK
jgi:hypothetical protein